MEDTHKAAKSPIAEGLGYGVVSFLAIDQTSPNYLMITSWACFLAYLIARVYTDKDSNRNETLAGIARVGRVIGWTLIIGLALISCIGAAQE